MFATVPLYAVRKQSPISPIHQTYTRTPTFKVGKTQLTCHAHNPIAFLYRTGVLSYDKIEGTKLQVRWSRTDLGDGACTTETSSRIRNLLLLGRGIKMQLCERLIGS